MNSDWSACFVLPWKIGGQKHFGSFATLSAMSRLRQNMPDRRCDRLTDRREQAKIRRLNSRRAPGPHMPRPCHSLPWWDGRRAAENPRGSGGTSHAPGHARRGPRPHRGSASFASVPVSSCCVTSSTLTGIPSALNPFRAASVSGRTSRLTDAKKPATFSTAIWRNFRKQECCSRRQEPEAHRAVIGKPHGVARAGARQQFVSVSWDGPAARSTRPPMRIRPGRGS